MPILPPEPDFYPSDLFDAAGLPADVRWWALYTLPRREKELMRRLQRLKVPHYGPMVKRRNQSPGGRVRTSHNPLFAGYVFICGADADRYHAMTTNCVSRCLEVPDAGQLFTDLRQIQRLIASDAPLTPEAQIEPGMRIRIRNGPFMGLEGTVIKRRGAERLLVVVHFLQQGASVQLDDYQVEQV